MQQPRRPIVISRRQFLALSATVVVAACAGESGGDPGSATDTPAPPPAPNPTTPGTTATTATAPAITTTPPASPPPPTSLTTQPIALADDPFRLGVASGDPDDTSVTLWTRLTGDLPDEIEVVWELLDGEQLIATDRVIATATHAHSVHVVVAIDRPLTYRFRVGGYTSPSGTTQPAGQRDELRLAAASCQHFETGYYAAHRDLAEWRPDLVIFLGDFIYEGASRALGGEVLRSHDGPEATDLAGYRNRYAQYLGDQQLRDARAACPWLVIWDDHEVENDYAGDHSDDGEDPTTFAARRAQAYQAWWEHTPTRLPPPDGERPYTVYRAAEYGELASISALDGRQFRSVQACGNPKLDTDLPCDEVYDETRTMLGNEQEAWLAERFASTTAAWNVLAQQTVLSDVTFAGSVLNFDQWDGYPAARDRLLAMAPADLIVLTGDIHLAGLGTLGGVGVEFVTTAVSSSPDIDASMIELFLALGQISDAELVHRGYIRHTVTRDTWSADYRMVTDVADPESPVTTWKTFTVAHGTATAIAG